MLHKMKALEKPSSRALVGSNLRTFRKAAGLSQEGLAESAGVSRATVAAIELGRYSSVELSTLDALAAALMKPESAFLARPGESAGLVAEFLKSPWQKVAHPTDEEKVWLANLPSSLWAGKEPDMQTVYELLELLRRHLR